MIKYEELTVSCIQSMAWRVRARVAANNYRARTVRIGEATNGGDKIYTEWTLVRPAEVFRGLFIVTTEVVSDP